jgi:site-specific recombinase XerD
MFDQLFGKLSAVVHHRAAPYAAERERFLEHCARQGYSSHNVKKLAALLLVAAHELHSDEGLRASPEDVEAAADRVQQLRAELHRPGNAHTYRKIFVRVTTQWLIFAGGLQVPTIRPRHFLGLLDDFAEWMAQERGLSPRTIRNRRWHVARFLSWLEKHDRPVADLQLRDLDTYFEALHAKGLSRVTIKVHANGVRAFLRHAERRAWYPTHLADLLSGPRIYRQQGLPLGPSWDDVQRLIESTASDEPGDIRDRAILLLFAVYGLRASEVAELRVDDLDWEHDRLTVPRSKQRRRHIYPLVPSVGQAIIRYLKEVRPHSALPNVFLKLLAPVGPMTSGGLYLVVAKRLKRLGIETRRYGPHALRHACAGRLLAQGLSLKEIGDHLGHRSVSSTRVYAKVDLHGLHEVAAFDCGEVL